MVFCHLCFGILKTKGFCFQFYFDYDNYWFHSFNLTTRLYFYICMLFQNNVMYFTLCENTLPHYFSMFSLCLFFSYFLSIQHNQKKMPDNNIEHWDNLEDLFDTSKIQDIQHQDYIAEKLNQSITQ